MLTIYGSSIAVSGLVSMELNKQGIMNVHHLVDPD